MGKVCFSITSNLLINGLNESFSPSFFGRSLLVLYFAKREVIKPDHTGIESARIDHRSSGLRGHSQIQLVKLPLWTDLHHFNLLLHQCALSIEPVDLESGFLFRLQSPHPAAKQIWSPGHGYSLKEDIASAAGLDP